VPPLPVRHPAHEPRPGLVSSDPRVDDHAALSTALRRHDRVYCVFVFDRTILDPLPRVDRRVEFIVIRHHVPEFTVLPVPLIHAP
jgi:deoxyribodipyrimidine photo-lyase